MRRVSGRARWLSAILTGVALIVPGRVWAGAGTPEPVVVTLAGPPIWETAPLLDMVDRQPLKDRGIVFRFEPWTSSEAMLKGVLTQRFGLAVVPSLMAAMVHARGVAVVPLAGEVTEGSIMVLGRDRAEDQGQDQDQGALRMAIPFKGAVPDLLLRRVTRELPSLSYQAVYVDSPMAAMQQLKMGQVDAALVVDPVASLLRSRDLTVHPLIDLCATWKAATALPTCPVIGMLVTSGPMVRDGALLDAVRAAHAAAFARLAADPRQAVPLLVGQFPRLAPALPAPVFQTLKPVLLPLPAHRREIAGFLAEIATVSMQAVGGHLPDDTFYAGVSPWSPGKTTDEGHR